MRKVILLILGCLFVYISFAQGINWDWARNSKGPATTAGIGVATDKNGNVFMVGNYSYDTVIFGTTVLFNEEPHSTTYGVFLVKYDSLGNVLWAKSPVGKNYETSVGGVATDDSLNVYIIGTFGCDTLTFDSFEVYNTNSNNVNFFLAKYTSDGNVIWVKSGSAGCDIEGLGIATDRFQNIYITGQFGSYSVSFDSVTIYNSGGAQDNLDDIFICKYDGSGKALWAKGAGGADYPDGGLSVATDKNGDAFITGYFQSASITFDNYTLNSVNTGLFSIFTTKYDSLGNVVWAKNGIGASAEPAWGQCIATDAAGNAYITGKFSNDSISFGTITLKYSGNPSITHFFLVKYNPVGDVVWAKGAENIPVDNIVGYSVCTDKDDNVYVAGHFLGNSVIFDSTFVLLDTSAFQSNFIMKFDSNGHALLGDNFIPSVSSICSDGLGNVAIVGSLPPVNSIVFGGDTLVLPGSAFVAKFTYSLPTNLENIIQLEYLKIYPNPFRNSAIIQYSLPAGSTNASLIVNDLLGRQRVSYKLPNDKGQMTINGAELSDGVYFYSLLVDGKVLAVKKMVLQ